MKKTFLFLAALAMSAMMWAVDGTYKLCTSTDDLVAGEHYIIANGTDGDVYCMATESNANNRKKVSATVSESAIEVAEESGILTLTLGGETDAWTFYTDNYAGEDGYLASAASGKNNYCRVIADLTTATITFSEGSAAVINLKPHTERTLLRYNTSGMFACYASGQNPVYLYKKDSATPIPATLDSLIIKGKAEKMEYEVGEAFDHAGLEVWGIYTKTVKHDSTSQITSGITWTIDPETFAEASENASVTLSASYKDLTTADTTITGIKVSEPAPLPKYATIYTSNVEFTDEGGTKATLSQVVVAEGDTVDAIKCGTGSVDGSCVITIPAATKTLHFHAVAWSNKPTTMDVNGTIYDLTDDSGISGSGSTYTLAGDAYDYYFSYDPKGATVITFTAKSDHRFVLFGVNTELEEGAIAAPAFTPTDNTDFDGSVEVTLTCETEGAEIFYALNEEVTSMNAIKYTEPIKLTETTTIYAAAKKDGKESEHVSKTYTKIPEFASLEELVNDKPATDTKVKVKVTLTEVAIDSFHVSGEYTHGVYVAVNGAALELYKKDVPATWEEGGTISGTILADWSLYNNVPELQNFDSWDAFTYAEPSPIPEEITENFTPDLTKAVGLNEQTTAAVNEGVLTVIAASEPWAAAGVKIPFDGYVKTMNFAGIKASAKVPTGGIEVCAYVIDQDGKRWYQESMNSTTYADWASFAHTTVPFVTLWDGGTAEDWANAELVAFGFYGASGDGLVDFEINLKDVEILVGEQPIEALNYISARKKAAKQLINGQIMIIREGKVYNMLGF